MTVEEMRKLIGRNELRGTHIKRAGKSFMQLDLEKDFGVIESADDTTRTLEVFIPVEAQYDLSAQPTEMTYDEFARDWTVD